MKVDVASDKEAFLSLPFPFGFIPGGITDANAKNAALKTSASVKECNTFIIRQCPSKCW